jgi:ribosomal protein S18 acetylase RimI-like enzyme
VDNHSFGFVDEDTPELAIAVKKEFRGRGIGTSLMNHLMQHAKNKGIRRISLSVDPENHARNLYEELGFEKVGQSGTSWTMLIHL